MSEENTVSELLKSKYSSGISINIRIDGLWQTRHRDVRAGNFLLWNVSLDSIFAELVADITAHDGAGNKLLKQIEVVNEQVVKLSPLKSGTPAGFGKLPISYYETVSKQYQSLLKKEVLIRKLQNHLGKGSTYKDDSEDDFD